MTRPRKGRRAAVLAAALHSWATTTADPAERTTRLITREGPGWQEAGITNLTDQQVGRLLSLLRQDLIPDQPATPIQVAATLDQLIAEWRAEGKTAIRPADLTEALPRLGCTAAELAVQIVRLIDQRYLQETRRPGTYRLRPT
jgi:hypothetical protein